jgi:hypothetical protein
VPLAKVAKLSLTMGGGDLRNIAHVFPLYFIKYIKAEKNLGYISFQGLRKSKVFENSIKRIKPTRCKY